MLLSLGQEIRELQVSGFTFLEFVGLALTFILIVYHVPGYLKTIYRLWIAPALGKTVDFRRMGEWAAVTGSSDGIGKAYAYELANRGVNLILISRSKQKLEAVAKDIEAKFPVKTKIVEVDFTLGLEVYSKIQDAIKDLEIGTLVNNVGMNAHEPLNFLEHGETFNQDMLHCNVFSITMMTKMILPQMVARGKGVVVNVGSSMSVMPLPLFTMYCATKAFIYQFSECLSLEYQNKGIIVQTLVPGWVCTNMSQRSTPSVGAPTSESYAKSAVPTVGVEQRTAGYFSHRLALSGYVLLMHYCRDWWFNFARIVLPAYVDEIMEKRRRQE